MMIPGSNHPSTTRLNSSVSELRDTSSESVKSSIMIRFRDGDQLISAGDYIGAFAYLPPLSLYQGPIEGVIVSIDRTTNEVKILTKKLQFHVVDYYDIIKLELHIKS